MAKKTATKKPVTKKPRRRLKRTARRSLAAVLMITAVVVAAIPVPENVAAPEDYGISALADGFTDVHKLGSTDNPDPNVDGTNYKAYKYEPTAKDDVSLGTTANLDLSLWESYAENDPDTMMMALRDPSKTPSGLPRLYASYSVSNPQGNTYSLSWQFMYYEVTNPGSLMTAGAICKYNTEYYTDNVDLSLFPNTEYFVAKDDEISKFYAGTMTDDAVNLHYLIKDGDKTLHTMDIDPTKDLTVYTYSDFDRNGNNSAEVQEFLQRYPSVTSKYNDAIAAFEQYKKDMEEYSRPGSTMATMPTKPNDFKIKPSQDLTTSAERMRFFCEHNVDLGKEYTLVPAKDNRPLEDQGDIYLAQGKVGQDGVDKLGFRVLKTSDYQMCAIANKAFYRIGNVDNIDIPAQIGYIGDDAFSESQLEGVSFANVTLIGNRAFKNCVVLSTAELELSTEQVGAECFSGTKIQSVKFGSRLRRIGYGAFYNCRSLTSIAFESNGMQAEVDGYAFYNCPALTKIEMKDANIIKLGDGVFATDAGSQAMGITLPQGLSDPTGLGNYLFAGRSSLEYVVFPGSYGHSGGASAATVPPAMFHGCSLLQYVEFPADPKTDRFGCGFVSFDEDVLFSDVINEDFYVKGPELNENGGYAEPRECTWVAKTAVSNVVPYVYKDKDGNEFYEVSDGYYLLSIRKTENNTGILTSCTLSPKAPTEPWNGVLEIPAEVGGTKVVSYQAGCFKDSNLNENVKKLVISDDSIQSIDPGVFKGGTGDNDKDWLQLKEVYIGNSVKEIGDSAFEGCDHLIDVTFSSPEGFEPTEFKMGKNAFSTNSPELTFHGDIQKGYAPFDWAMDPNNIIDKDLGDASKGLRVCYKSMAPSFITVMYNPITDMVTMLDYPKYDQIDSILKDTYGVPDYNRYREQVLYDSYRDSRYDDSRRAFANAWKDATDENVDELYSSDSYGPWVNPEFANGGWRSYVTDTSGGGTGGTDGASTAGLMDWLFEPLTVQAAPATVMDAYYAHKGNAYDVHLRPSERGPYRPSTPTEDYLLNAVENIVIPEGVDSIDVYGFVNDLTTEGKENTDLTKTNGGNASQYFTTPSNNSSWDSDTKRMYTIDSFKSSGDDESTTVKSVPGLFSGYYIEPSEDNARGNDTIRTVTMNSVKYLPDYAFDNCEQLQTVILGAHCADIGVAPFRGCKALRSVSNNDYYETDNGIIYSKEADGSYVIEECFASRGDPEIVGQAAVNISSDPKLTSVSAIKPGAFEDCDVISSIDFSADNEVGLTTIPENCFKDCGALSRITLPRSVNNIEKGAFAGLSNLTGLLTIYGKEVKISGQAFDIDPDKKSNTPVKYYADSAVERYVKEYGKDYKLEPYSEPLGDLWEVTYVGPDYKLLEDLVDATSGEKISNPQYVENGLKPKVPKDPVVEGWTFDKWVGMNGTEPGGQIFEDTVFFAQGYSNSGMVGGKYVVSYIDGVDGSTFATEYVSPGADAPDLRAPVHDGYEFDKWGAELTNVQSNRSILAIYKVAGAGTSGGSTNTSGGTTNTSGGATNTSGGATNTSNNSTSSKKSSSSSSSSSSTSTSSGTGAVTMHRVTVVGGSGSGTYAVGATVVISANDPAAGMKFTGWTTDSSGVTLNQMTAASTMFDMPDNDVLVVANYEGGTAATPITAPVIAPVPNNNGQTENNGNTRVDITKPGISNRDLATANVNGSTDNFIIKISETDEATRAVADALTNKYGNLENILYYAMDITLWDATGSYQLTGDQLNGISVDITIPIPDSLVAYGGNNMAGAVINGNQLESLNENFTTINGVPCIRFQATHFSPYTIYVDTGNLVEGMLDTTPKTGDPIHPKWFLSLGLACLSMILFLKRDKKVKVKA